MSDLISRQSAVDELVKMLSDCFYADEEVLDAVETTLKELPPAQPDTYWKEQCQSYERTINKLRESLSTQPEIIRCKDCKYWNKGSCECREIAVNCQDYMVGDMETEPEHFCGYAERKEVTT